MRKARTNRDVVAEAIEAAVEQATLAYQFSPGSYTASALGACLHAREAVLTMPRLRFTTIDKGEWEALRKARKQPSAQQAKPWKADGISRATWYRRQHQA